MAYYTCVEQIGSKIYHRYIDDNGEAHSEVVREFPIELYIKGKKKPDSSRGLMGETLNKISFTSISDAKEFIYQYKDAEEIFGQTNLAYQFISHTYPEADIQFDSSKIKILIIDIETAFDDSGFPTPEKANQEIIAITCKVFGEGNKFICFGSKEIKKPLPDDVVYHQCRHENNLLSSFLQFWQEINPDIITGWNSDGFDIPYIINRCNKVLGEKTTKKFSPFYKSLDKCIVEDTYGQSKTLSYNIVGITKLDYLDLYKKYAYSTLESFRLEVVAQHELGEGKVDYSEYRNLMDLYERNFDKFLEYNIHDVRLVENLEHELNYLFLALTIAYLGKIKYSDIHGQIKFWDSYVTNYLLTENVQIPPSTRNHRQEIVGAYVKDPTPARYKWIVTLDLTSLYPSIIMTWNMSPETQVETAHYGIKDIEKFIGMEIDTSHLKKKNWAMLANGACFSRETGGVFPILVDRMFQMRKKYKGKMLEAQTELESIREEIVRRGIVL